MELRWIKMKNWDKGKYKLQIVHPDGYWEDVPVDGDKPEPKPKRNDGHSEDCEVCHQVYRPKFELWWKMKEGLRKAGSYGVASSQQDFELCVKIAEEHFKDSK